MYFFFRESAVEHMNCGKAVYARVARVCKVRSDLIYILSYVTNGCSKLKIKLPFSDLKLLETAIFRERPLHQAECGDCPDDKG